MKELRKIAVWVDRWPIALAVCFVLGLLVLLPALGSAGLWEPQERQLSDRIAPHLSIDQKGVDQKGVEQKAEETKKTETCERAVPKDARARSLTKRAIVWGRDTIEDSDTGRKLPLALFGVLTLLATAGIALRAAGGRAAVITTAVLMSMPLLGLQSRMLTSEIGTACGGALIVYALVAATRPVKGALLGLDLAISVLALAGGIVVGFYAGGALLGLVVPIGAFAAAGGLGAPLAIAAVKRRPWLEHLPAAIATLAVAGLVGVLAYQLYELKDPVAGITPPARQVLGNAIVPDGCYSSLLGAIWRPEDDLRFIYDSMFEQIAYGTFPWGILAPLAMYFLLRDDDPGRRLAGGVALAWGGGAWIASEAFQRKVGFTIYAGFPALAVAVGVWLDGVFARRGSDRDTTPTGAILVALVVAFAVLDLGKDVLSFPDKLTSLLTGPELVTYPAVAKLKLWVLSLGMVIAVGFGVALVLWRRGDDRISRRLRLAAEIGGAVAIGGSIIFGAFWTFAWHPRLASHLSSKQMFDTYHELKKPNDAPLVIMGDLGQAPKFYTSSTPQIVPARGEVVKALSRADQRVFAIAPRTELCTMHREMGEKPYFVVEDRNVKSLLFSNRVDGTTDKNSLAKFILHKEPATIRARPKGQILWEGKIQLLGWDMPKRVSRGGKLKVKLYFKTLGALGGAYKILMHFDGGQRFQGDHEPLAGLCNTGTWMTGDYIVDTIEIEAGGGGHPLGRYDLWIGFFTGSAPNWRNLTVTSTVEQRDDANRVKIASIILD